jgi:cobyrinic acid a,c-diamide synthase
MSPSAVNCPAILVAAPASGQGKTTVAAALARLQVRRGQRVTVFKYGSDFLDPHWLALSSGGPVHQLDLWMTGEADCRARLAAAALYSDLIIVEGVMGLFDGDPSAADLAQRFGLPVLAVIDASVVAGTFGALAFGLQHYRPDMPWLGVLANRVGGERHASMFMDSVREPAHWLGALMHNPYLSVPERHLGLKLASDMLEGLTTLDAAADALGDTPLGQMTLSDWQRWSVNFTGPEAVADDAITGQRLAGRTIAVARDEAFCFNYDANLECLKALGAEVVFFSPLVDSALPVCDAVWLPGGYPELHATVLGGNAPFINSLKAHVAAHKPIWAECGGMMPLFDVLIDRDGHCETQWGLLPGTVSMHTLLVGLGPQQWASPAGVMRGHTFHYSTCTTAMSAIERTNLPNQAPSQDAGEAVYHYGSLRASYFHAWFWSSPAATANLFSDNAMRSHHV